MKRLVVAALLLFSLGGCFHEAALDRHLYDGMKNGLSGAAPAPIGPQAAILVPAGEAAPPLRDPSVAATGIPAPSANSVAPAAPASTVAPTAPASPS
jgi:hypothetical protein